MKPSPHRRMLPHHSRRRLPLGAVGFPVVLALAALLSAAESSKPERPKPAPRKARSTAGGGTPVTLEPVQKIMGTLVRSYRPMRIKLDEEPPFKLLKQPKYQSKTPLYGVLELGEGKDNRFVIVLDEPEGDKPRIYIDRNGDRNLTNDGPGEWTRQTPALMQLSDVAIDVPYRSGKTPYTLEFMRSKTRAPDTVVYYRNAARVGEAALDGKKYKILVLDDNSDALFDDLERGTIVIDRNRDGKLDTDSDSAETFRLGEPFNIDGKVWEVAAIKPNGLELTFRHSTATVPEKPYLDPGCPAPPFAGKDLAQRPVELKAEASRARFVLVDFWASWCGPCRAEFPTLRRLHARYKSHGLQIVGVNLDSERSAAVEAAQAANLDYPHLFDGGGWKNAVAGLYRVHGIPQTYLVDKDMKIVAKGLRGEGLERKLRELLGPGDEKAAAAADKPADAPRKTPASGPAAEPPAGKTAKKRDNR